MASQTILKSLKSKINFPLPEESYSTALIEAGLDGDAVYTKDLKKDVELCAAELILVVCTSGNVSEGGYSLSISDKKSLMSARSIYLKRWNTDDEAVEKSTVSSGSGLW
jgi:hypothetical protein